MVEWGDDYLLLKMIIAITGSISCGKTFVCNNLSQKEGVFFISTDQIGHELLKRKSQCYQLIVDEFGEKILDSENNISREKLGQIVFEDQNKREKLNAIVHPLIRKEWKSRARENQKTNPDHLVLVEIPLLYETGAESEFDRVVAVLCSVETQISRLMEYRHLDVSQAQARIKSQMSADQKAAKADYVIWNEYSPRILERQIELLVRKLGL